MDYKTLLKTHLLDEATFIKATFSGRQRGHDVAWQRVTARPVRIRGQQHLQVSHFDEKQDITKNYAGAEAKRKVDALLALPFKHFDVQTTTTHIQVRISKKGKVFVQEEATTQAPPSLAHDRHKEQPFSADQPDPFLQAIGLMTPSGKIRARKRRKFKQINEFLRLALESGELEHLRPPVHIVDCGCGSADLTFAIYHYLNHARNIPVQAVGIDIKADLIDKQMRLVQDLGWEGLTFEVSRILDYQPQQPPDIVLALHACDTATDEALAQAVRWDSHMIFSAPCCHHHLQAQIDARPTPEVFKPILRHGILKERLGDVLTDSFRAQLLRVTGYRAEVVEFISPEHTNKNLMIRAVKIENADIVQARADYETLKAYWGVTPYLETLLEVETRK